MTKPNPFVLARTILCDDLTQVRFHPSHGWTVALHVTAGDGSVHTLPPVPITLPTCEAHIAASLRAVLGNDNLDVLSATLIKDTMMALAILWLNISPDRGLHTDLDAAADALAATEAA